MLEIRTLELDISARISGFFNSRLMVLSKQKHWFTQRQHLSLERRFISAMHKLNAEVECYV